MGQLLTLSQTPRDHQQSEESTITNSKASKQSTNETQGLVVDLGHRRAQTSQPESNPVAERMADGVERVKKRLDQSGGSERVGQGLAEAATLTRAEVARGERDAREEHERARKMCENAEMATGAAREDAERAQREAELLRRGAEALAKKAFRTAPEGAWKDIESREAFKRRFKEGSQPFFTPSPEEFAAAKRRIQYRDGCFNFAVAGVAGSGKSSLVNAFRGLRSRDAGAAPVGITERALQVARYPDQNPENPFVWYEIPGAGAIKRHDWQYFHDQGLFVFDAIVILFDTRFTLTDVAILANARRFDIPTYIVRSKADRYIRNMMSDMGDDSDDDNQDVERRNELYDAARKQFIEGTRKTVQANLENANLLDQRVYIVSSHTLLSIVRNKTPKKLIDEVELLHDLFNQVNTRRVTGESRSRG